MQSHDTESQQLHAHVLIADDNPDYLQLLSLYLRRAGATVTVTENGQSAYEMIANNKDGAKFDIIIMDNIMPVLNGYEATKKLRQYGYQKPIIALTGFSADDEKEKCLSVGYNDILEKPVDSLQLINTIQKLLRNTA